MAFVTPPRVLETGTGSGTGDVTLLGAVGSGEYDSFNEHLAVNDTTIYVIVDGSQFEIGYGTYSSATPNNGTLTRDTVIKSSSGTSKISLSGSNFNIFHDIPNEAVLVVGPDGAVTNVSAVAGAVIPKDLVTLKALEEPLDNTVVWLGYGVTEGDGLGGKFRWDDGSTATADDINIVQLDAIGAGPGRWIRERDFLWPAEVAGDSNPVDTIARRSDTHNLVSNRTDTGYKTIPEVQTVARVASYATLAALKAVASTNWKQGDIVELRGWLADGDLDFPVLLNWEASSTNTDSLDIAFIRPDDISGSNPGRFQIKTPARAIKFADSDATPSVKNGILFTGPDAAPAAITAFDDFRDGKTIVIQPGAVDLTIAYDAGVLETPMQRDFILKTRANGGLPIILYKENGVVSFVGGAGAGASFGEFVANVTEYGAVGDGSTDDTAAIQAAIDTGYDVFFPKPEASYYCASGLTVDTRGQVLFGAHDWVPGEGLGHLITTDLDGVLFTVTEAGVTFTGLQFRQTDGGSVDVNAIAILGQKASNTDDLDLRVSRCVFNGFLCGVHAVGRGLFFEQNAVAGSVGLDIVVKRTWPTSGTVGDAFQTDPEYGWRKDFYLNNYIHTSDIFISVEGANAADYRAIIANNQLDRGGRLFQGAFQSLIVSGNYIEYYANSAIRITGSNARGLLFSGNVVSGPSEQNIAAYRGFGIECHSGAELYDSVFTGNKFKTITNVFSLINPQNIVIRNNVFEDVKQSCIAVAGGDNILVDGNTFIDCSVDAFASAADGDRAILRFSNADFVNWAFTHNTIVNSQSFTGDATGPLQAVRAVGATIQSGANVVYGNFYDPAKWSPFASGTGYRMPIDVDLDSEIYSNQDDQYFISLGAAARIFTFNLNGMGIGTTTPLTPLHVARDTVDALTVERTTENAGVNVLGRLTLTGGTKVNAAAVTFGFTDAGVGTHDTYVGFQNKQDAGALGLRAAIREGLMVGDVTFCTTPANDPGYGGLALQGSLKIAGALNQGAPGAAIAIAGGVLTIPSRRSYVRVDAEAAAATDDLDTITMTGVQDGDRLLINQAAGARDVTVRHNTGNIIIADGANKAMTNDYSTVELIYRADTTKWMLINANL